MDKQWVFLTGWGCPHQVYEPFVDARVRFVDSNLLVASIVRDGKLGAGWPEEISEMLAAGIPQKPWGLAGWSMGAMIALATAPLLKPSQCIFLSATARFVRDSANPHGWRAAVLRSMRGSLESGVDTVVSAFLERCGFVPPFPECKYSVAQLQAGLHFLEQADVTKCGCGGISKIFFHGEDDPVVPLQAGRAMAESCGGELNVCRGGHAFFTTDASSLRDMMGIKLCI
jgi:pimeloyl-ACP methyl ester carboxylesterase